MYLIGYDLGTSSLKASLIEVATGKVIASTFSPSTEMPITALKPGWAEQNPEMWWDNLIIATKTVLAASLVKKEDIKAVGISYQMHGLVMVDKNHKLLKSAILWCDSRAVPYGDQAFEQIGEKKCLSHLLNSPGNFTASKLKWVKENEKDLYSKIYKIMLPGDYLAMKLSGQISTTITGLSEGILWDYKEQKLADLVLDNYGLNRDYFPEALPVFTVHGELSGEAANILGLQKGTLISYKAGDVPNNAFSLNVLEPGEVAATAGTAGIVYGISEKPIYDDKSRVNIFAHVNHTTSHARHGVLLCTNGTGILNSYMRNTLLASSKLSYQEMDKLASEIKIGSDGLRIFPFGNGAERSLENKDLGYSLHGLRFNTHKVPHMLRATQEGIVFFLNHGMNIIKDMGLQVKTVKAGKANMFLSPIFKEAFANLTGAELKLYNTDGAQGCARGAGVGAGIYKNTKEAFIGLEAIETISPDTSRSKEYKEAYDDWYRILQKLL
ncbi:MAG: xylulokinase [Cytophagaceae bacterium]